MTRILLILLVFLGVQNAFANPLLQNPNRPTVTELKNAAPNWQQANPIPAHNSAKVNWIRTNLDYVAQVIVQFERTFPGATFAFLGRDSAFISDLFESYYQGIGQTGRAMRLNASGNSINNATEDVHWEFLKTNGIDPARLAENPAMIMIDATNWADSSQSTKLIRAAYHGLTNAGILSRHIARRVNFVNIKAQQMYNKYPVPQTDAVQFMREQEVVVTKHGPAEILTIDTTALAYASEWHDTFSRFEKLPDGRTVAHPGVLKPIADRNLILWEQYELLRILSSPEFQAKVIATAKSLNFEFPMTRVPPQPFDKTVPGASEEHVVDRLLARLKFVLEEMKVLDKNKYAQDLIKNLTSHAKKDHIEFFVRMARSGTIPTLVKAGVQIPYFNGEHFLRIPGDLLKAGLTYSEIAQLAQIQISANAPHVRQNFVKGALESVTTTSDYLAIAEFGKSVMTGATIGESASVFLEMKPTAAEVRQLVSLYPDLSLSIKILLTAKNTTQFFEALSKLGKEKKDFAFARQALGFFMDLDPTRAEVRRYIDTLGEVFSKTDLAVMEFAELRSATALIQTLAKVTATLNPGEKQEVVQRTTGFFMKLKPTYQELKSFGKAAAVFEPNVSELIWKQGLSQGMVQNLNQLGDLLLYADHTVTPEFALQVKNFMASLGNDSTIMAQLKPTLADLERFQSRVGLPDHYYLQLVKANFVLGQFNAQEILKVSNLLIDRSGFQSDMNVFLEKFLSTKPTIEQVKQFELSRNALSMGETQILRKYAIEQARTLESFLAATKPAGQTPVAAARSLEAIQSLVPKFEAHFMSLKPTLQQVGQLAGQCKMSTDQTLGWFEAWAREGAVTTAAYQDFVGALSSQLSPRTLKSVLKGSLDRWLALNPTIDQLKFVETRLSEFSPKMWIKIWRTGIAQAKTASDFNKVVANAHDSRTILRGMVLSGFLETNMDRYFALKPTGAELVTLVRSTYLHDNITQKVFDYAITQKLTATEFIEIARLVLRGITNSEGRDLVISKLSHFATLRPSVNELNRLLSAEAFDVRSRETIVNQMLFHLRDPQNANQIQIPGISLSKLRVMWNAYNHARRSTPISGGAAANQCAALLGR